MQTRRDFLATTASLAALSATGTGQALAQNTPRDTVVMAKQIDDIVSLDPAEAFEFSGGEVIGNCYDKLISFDFADPSKLNGELAESWTIDDAGTTYTFRLRQGVKFHSGNPFTSADVVYSIQRAVTLNKSPGFILTQFGINKDNVTQVVRAPDPATVVVTVDKAYAPSFFLNCLTANVAAIVDSVLVKSREQNSDFGYEWLKQNSAGSGAYQLRGYRANEQYAMEANASWYKGAPRTHRVVVRHVPEPASQRLLLERGDVDYARNLTKDQLEAIRASGNITTQQGDKGYILYLGLNQRNPNLAKPEVREALKWLVDYDAIDRNIVAGTYRPHQSFLPAGFLGAITDRPYRFDLDKGKELLARAGLANGFQVTMDVRTTAPIPDIAQAIQATWAQANVRLELIPGSGAQTLTKYRARTHDIYIGQWGPDYQDPHTNAETFAVNENNGDDARSKTLAWRNAWDIPDMTRRTLAAVLERDTDKRKAEYEAIQREHQRISPFVMLFQQIEVAAVRNGVTGLVLGPGSAANLYSQIAKA